MSKDPAAVSLGSRGGKARAANVLAGKTPITGFAVPKPTACTKCGETQPSYTAARAHCRQPRTTSSALNTTA